MPTCLITPEVMLHVDAPYSRMLREAGFEIRYPANRYFARGIQSEEETVAEMRGVHAIIAGGEHYTPTLFAALPDLRVVARAGVGYDRVDVAAASRHRVAVTITPTANHEAVAEHALALLFGVSKAVVVFDQATRAGTWPRDLTMPIRGKTLGILGLGRIGKSLAVRAVALGMKVIATEAFPDHAFLKRHEIELVDFDTLLSRSDVLSIHCPMMPETRGLFNRAVFARMKPGAILLNTARGPIVVEADLVEALQTGRLAGAGLDVFEVEPTSADNPLYKLSNVVLSPHIAGSDTRSLEDMGIESAQNIIDLYRGKWPEGKVVNSELKAEWKW